MQNPPYLVSPDTPFHLWNVCESNALVIFDFTYIGQNLLAKSIHTQTRGSKICFYIRNDWAENEKKIRTACDLWEEQKLDHPHNDGESKTNRILRGKEMTF